VRQTGNCTWEALCPAHDDGKPSLSIRISDTGKVLVHCHAGCKTPAVLAKLGLRMEDLFPAGGRKGGPTETITYDYCDAEGELVHQTVRYPGKKFRQRQPDGKDGWIWNLRGVHPLLYQLPELIKSDPSALVYVPEGEKDVDSIRGLGLVATCNPMGAGKWDLVAEDAARVLAGRSVVVVADKDDPGRDHAQAVAKSLFPHVASVKVIELPGEAVKDATDWITAGGNVEQLGALVEVAPTWVPPENGGKEEDRGSSGGKKQAREIVALFTDDPASELFHTADFDAYAVFTVKDHRETARVTSPRFERQLRWIYFEATGQAPSSYALGEAQNTLESLALFKGPCEEVHTRIAGDGIDTIYVDLCDAEWRVVEISATTGTYQVINNPPVRFMRARGMQALPVPESGGSLLELRRLINIGNDANWALLLGWLVAALRPRGPYPVLVVYGEQGTAKSTLVRILRALVDPNKADLRAEPRDTHDLAIAAANGWVVALDNISLIKGWLSDALCRLSTGGGFGTRELFTDRDEVIFDAERPVVLTGIEEIATRGDLLDRCVSIELDPIPEEQRRPESELWADVKASAGQIFGALLAAVAYALRTHKEVHLSKLPRMADFAVWATAAERGLGLPAGAIMSAYTNNRASANDVALGSSAIASFVMAMVRERGNWSGTATNLLEDLNKNADDDLRRARGWPRSPQSLGGALRRLAPNLRAAGIDVVFDRAPGHDRGRLIILTARPPESSTQSALSDGGLSADAGIPMASPDGGPDRNANRPPQPSAANAKRIELLDGTDDSDSPGASDVEEVEL
jgi:hypothetical protein